LSSTQKKEKNKQIRQKNVKKLSKSCQKSCQKVVTKVVKKLSNLKIGYKKAKVLKRVGGEEEDL
jgi:hypothetical protein